MIVFKMLLMFLILGLLAFTGYYVVVILPSKVMEARRKEHERLTEEELRPYRHQAVSEIEEFLSGLRYEPHKPDENEHRNQINETKK